MERLTPVQAALLQAHLIVEARLRYFRERREKLKSAKFHKPKGEYVFSSFDVIDYGDEEFDPAAPFGKGIFDHIIFKEADKEDTVDELC